MKLSGKSYHVNLSFTDVILLLVYKVLGVGQRISDWLRLLPIRVYRVIIHTIKGLRYFNPRAAHWKQKNWKKYALQKWSYWSLEYVAYIADCFGIGEIYETLFDIFKFNARPLQDWEIELAKTVFADSINYKRVRIDEYAFAGPRQRRFIYVSFYTINSWGPMQNSILLHELMHVWQYEHLGAVYIPRALKAQISVHGYDYGGVEALKSYIEEGKNLFDFNLEQQSDVVADYFLIKEGYHPRWGQGKKEDLPIYEAFIKDLRV